jgi:NADPH:quinone reductase-like Zn-dependent oxidoreductase
MKAVNLCAFGGPDVLVYEDAPRPHPGDGEVLVRVHAAGINPVDWKIREGRLQEMIRHTLPLVLGWEVSGVVAAVGSGVTRRKVGDEVFSRPGTARDGAYAEFIVIRESEAALRPKPIGPIRVAALPLAGLTAWQSLFDAGGLSAGQRMLVHGTAGGAGPLTVRLAKGKEAHVTGTASAKNHDFLRRLGVDRVVAYRTVKFEEAVPSVDMGFGPMGGDVPPRSWQVLRRGGILVSIARPPPAEIAALPGVRPASGSARPGPGQPGEIARLADTEKLRAIIETVLPLSAATRGQEVGGRGHPHGQIVRRVV